MSQTRYYIRHEERGQVHFFDPTTRILYNGSEDCPAAYATPGDAEAAMLEWFVARAREDGFKIGVVAITSDPTAIA